jgi:hypothetical protein
LLNKENFMQTLYNSDSFTVVAFDMAAAAGSGEAPHSQGGFEIVDKFAQTGIFIQGAVAESFQQGVQALVANGEPDEEALDDFIAGFTLLAQQPVLLH